MTIERDASSRFYCHPKSFTPRVCLVSFVSFVSLLSLVSLKPLQFAKTNQLASTRRTNNDCN